MDQEKRQFISKPEGLTPLVVTIGVGSVAVAELLSNNPAQAQETEPDYSQFIDCGYGRYPKWTYDNNGDGQPGPAEYEFNCRTNPGCSHEHIGVPYGVNVSSSPGELYLKILSYNTVVCEGDAEPNFDSFFSDNYSEIVELLETVDQDLLEELAASRPDNPWAKIYIREFTEPTTAEPEQPDTGTTTTTTETEPETTTEPLDDRPEEVVEEPTTAEPEQPDTGTTTTTTETEPETTTEPLDDRPEEVVEEPTTAEPEQPDTGTTTTTTETEPETTTEPLDDRPEEVVEEPTTAEPEQPDTGTTTTTTETEPETTTEPLDDRPEEVVEEPTTAEPEQPDTGTTTTTTETEPETTTEPLDDRPEEVVEEPTTAEPEQPDTGTTTTTTETEPIEQPSVEDSSYVPEVIGGSIAVALAAGALGAYLKKRKRS